MNSYKLISIETVSLPCWLPLEEAGLPASERPTIKCPLPARLPEMAPERSQRGPEGLSACLLSGAIRHLRGDFSRRLRKHELAPSRDQALPLLRDPRHRPSCDFHWMQSVSRPLRRPEDAEQKTREPLGLKSLPGLCPLSPCSEGTLSPGSGAGRLLQRRVEGSLSSTRGSEGSPWVYKPSPSHAVTASSIGPHTRVTGYGRGRASV